MLAEKMPAPIIRGVEKVLRFRIFMMILPVTFNEPLTRQQQV